MYLLLPVGSYGGYEFGIVCCAGLYVYLIYSIIDEESRGLIYKYICSLESSNRTLPTVWYAIWLSSS